MYEYKAFVKRVVDGDTYDVIVDLGFEISFAIRVRLNGVDTPETWRPKTEAERVHGENAKDLVEMLIQDKEVTIRSYKLGIYGRYSADVILPDGRDLATVLKEAGMEKRADYSD
jgi:micrococcal nuclease